MIHAHQVETRNAPVPVGPYSQGIVTSPGQMLFVAGQLPINPKTNEVIVDDIKQATVLVMENIGAILKEAGMSFDNIVKTTIYITDMSLFSDVNEVYNGYFKKDKPYPARETVAVKGLAKGTHVEISVIACK